MSCEDVYLFSLLPQTSTAHIMLQVWYQSQAISAGATAFDTSM